MEEKIRISMLLQIYGKLLTEKQFEFMDYYYNEDLSLSEIAENQNITRQAVREILAKSKNKLEEYEEKVMFYKKISKINPLLDKLEKTNKKEIQEIRKILND